MKEQHGKKSESQLLSEHIVKLIPQISWAYSPFSFAARCGHAPKFWPTNFRQTCCMQLPENILNGKGHALHYELNCVPHKMCKLKPYPLNVFGGGAFERCLGLDEVMRVEPP